MIRTILVAYGTKRGSTQEVAEAVGAALRERGLEVEVLPARAVDGLARYDAAVVGGSLYLGRWHADARRLLERHREELGRLPLAVFGLGPLKDAEGDLAESRRQLEKELAKLPGLAPLSLAVFGGVVDPAKLRFPFSRMPASDARNWDAIRRWANEVAAALDARRTADTAPREPAMPGATR